MNRGSALNQILESKRALLSSKDKELTEDLFSTKERSRRELCCHRITKEGLRRCFQPKKESKEALMSSYYKGWSGALFSTNEKHAKEAPLSSNNEEQTEALYPTRQQVGGSFAKKQ